MSKEIRFQVGLELFDLES